LIYRNRLTFPMWIYSKKRPSFLRPSLVRSKAHLAHFCVPKPAPESQPPPFKFGNGGAKPSAGVPMSLEDMFDESPQHDRVKNSLSGNFVGPRLKPPFGGVAGHGRGTASPASGAIRKNSHPFTRPRKQCRRSLSMFEHPDDVVRSKDPSLSPDASPGSIFDAEPGHTLQLPCFVPDDQPDSLPRIDGNILVDLLAGKYNDRFENFMIIDCRFEYEFEGGHINGAVNHNDKELLAAQLFSDPKAGIALIFHCEYSAHRAPIMYVPLSFLPLN
jgi:M-phase inducer tyrosine phosphatase